MSLRQAAAAVALVLTVPSPGVAVAAAAAPAGLPESSGGERVLSGPVDHVIATQAGLAVLRDGVVLLLDGQGRLLGRCAGGEQQAAGRARGRPRRDGVDAEDVLRAAGLPDDDDDSAEGEALLDDEGLGPSRRARRRPAAAPLVARDLAPAARGDEIWIATTRGLWRARADGRGCAPAALDGRDVARVAASGDAVVAAAGATVWRSRDGGASFEIAAVLAESVRALAVGRVACQRSGAGDGEHDGVGDGALALVASDDGVLELPFDGPARRVTGAPADAVALCGRAALALAADGAHAWAAGAPAATLASGPRPPARRVTCTGDGTVARWAAAGAGLWTSDDGLSWSEEPDGRALSIAAAARAGARWWLATGDGLVASADAESSALLRLVAGERPPRARPPRARGVWTRALPVVSVVAGGREQAARRGEWYALVLVTMRFGRPSRGSP